MVHRFVLSYLRENLPQAFLNALGICFEVVTMLALAGTTFRAVPHLLTPMIVLRWVIAIMVWIILGVAFIFMTINRYSQVRERTRQFAILKVLGASPGYILGVLFHESMLISVAGTIAGILLAQVGAWLIALALPDMFVMQNTYDWWILSWILSASCFVFAGAVSAWVATSQDLMQALSYEE